MVAVGLILAAEVATVIAVAATITVLRSSTFISMSPSSNASNNAIVGLSSRYGDSSTSASIVGAVGVGCIVGAICAGDGVAVSGVGAGGAGSGVGGSDVGDGATITGMGVWVGTGTRTGVGVGVGVGVVVGCLLWV